jgi:hypothetical protein
MGARRLLAGPGPRDALAGRMAEALARRMLASPSSHLETYPGETYAMDNAVAAAAIAVHDLGTGQDHRAVLERWVAYTRTHLLDPETGLVSFSLGGDGKPNSARAARARAGTASSCRWSIAPSPRSSSSASASTWWTGRWASRECARSAAA